MYKKYENRKRRKNSKGDSRQIPKAEIKTDLSFKEKIWYILEKSDTSTVAYTFAIFSV